MIDASECPFTIAAKQIERSPAESCCLSGPTAVEEPAAIVNEAQPTPRRHVSRCIVGSSRAKPRPKRAARRHHTRRWQRVLPRLRPKRDYSTVVSEGSTLAA